MNFIAQIYYIKIQLQYATTKIKIDLLDWALKYSKCRMGGHV